MRIQSLRSNGVATLGALVPQLREFTMSGNRLAFTAARLGAVKVPERGALYVYDTATPGLAMRITKAGARTFVLYRRIKGRPVRITLGAVGSMSIPDARRAAQQWVGQAAAGIDVVAKIKAARMRGRTAGDVFKGWLAVAEHRKRSWEDDKRLWEIWLEKRLKHRAIIEVTGDEMERLIQSIGAKHPRTANKCRALLGTVWAHAIRRGEAEMNPARTVQPFPERSRERFLRPDELERFLTAVAAEPPTWRDYFLVCLLTGQRRENISRLRWDELDLESGVWHIPATKAKSKRATTVPLTPLAVGLLKRRSEDTTGEWVFPSDVGSKDGCVREPRKPWLRVLTRAGIADLRIHDLRRSVASWLGASGANAYTIARALGHQSVRSGEAYVRLHADPVREAVLAIQTARPAIDAIVRRTLPPPVDAEAEAAPSTERMSDAA
jgi:integrase